MNFEYRFAMVSVPSFAINGSNIEALIVRVGFWGISYYTHSKEPYSSPYRSFKGTLIEPLQILTKAPSWVELQLEP